MDDTVNMADPDGSVGREWSSGFMRMVPCSISGLDGAVNLT